MASAVVRDFVADTEPDRRELLAHCYRMLGSVHDAEDVLQETYLRSSRSYDRFEHRSAVRTWLYRIASNAWLTALDGRDRRFLPSGPHRRAAAPAGQTAGVLILRDVPAFPAQEVAAMLDVSSAAVKSLLQRARARPKDVSSDQVCPAGPTDPAVRALLERYIAGFVNADLGELEGALRADAALEMTGSPTWFSGLDTCLRFIETWALGAPATGRWSPWPPTASPPLLPISVATTADITRTDSRSSHGGPCHHPHHRLRRPGSRRPCRLPATSPDKATPTCVNRSGRQRRADRI
ncbi:MAG: sigma factor [Phycicoccus sp.]